MEKLGIEPSLLAAQIVNFSIIIVVLTKLLYKPILTMLEKRRREIEEGLTLTQKMREEEEKLKSKKDKMLEETRKEGQALMEEARKQAAEEAKDIVAAGHKEAGLIIEKGRQEVVQIKAAMEKDVRRSAVELAVRMTKRLLSSVLSADEKHKIITKHIKELESFRE